jgi:hypothetical protein
MAQERLPLKETKTEIRSSYLDQAPLWTGYFILPSSDVPSTSHFDLTYQVPYYPLLPTKNAHSQLLEPTMSEDQKAVTIWLTTVFGTVIRTSNVFQAFKEEPSTPLGGCRQTLIHGSQVRVCTLYQQGIVTFHPFSLH